MLFRSFITTTPAAEDDAGHARRWQPAAVVPWWWYTAAPKKVTADGARGYVSVEVIPGDATVTAIVLGAVGRLRLSVIAGVATGDAVVPGARPKAIRKNDDAETIAAGLMALMRRRPKF
jgi:hypothetical protein